LPIFEQLARVAERNIRGVVSWVRENRDLIAQGVVLVSTFTALATGLGAVALGASLGVRALGLLTTAISFLMSPPGLLITLAGLLAVAWAEDWGGIRKTTEDAVNFIRSQWDRLKQWWDESDLGKSVRDWWSKVVAMWEEELSLPEKVAATFRVVADTVELEAGDLAFILGAAVTAPTILRAIGDAIRTVPGVIAITQPGNILRLGIAGMILALGVYGWRLW